MFETWRHPFLKKPKKPYEVVFFLSCADIPSWKTICFYFRKVAILAAFKFQDDLWGHVEFMFWFTFFCCNKLTWKCPNVSLKISCAFTTTNAKTSSLTAGLSLGRCLALTPSPTPPPPGIKVSSFTCNVIVKIENIKECWAVLCLWIKPLNRPGVFSTTKLLGGVSLAGRATVAHPRRFHYPEELMERFNVKCYRLNVVSQSFSAC